MTTRADLGTKLAGERKLLCFPFTLAVGETISTKSVAATVYSGTDASPSSLISGSATNNGSVVQQLVVGGTAGVIYYLLCTITTSLGQTLNLCGYLAVIPSP